MTMKSQDTLIPIGQQIKTIDDLLLDMLSSMLEEASVGHRGNSPLSLFPQQRQNTWPSRMHLGMPSGFVPSTQNLDSTNQAPYRYSLITKVRWILHSIQFTTSVPS